MNSKCPNAYLHLRCEAGEPCHAHSSGWHNDPRIEGPLEIGWGSKDFEDQHNLFGLPNPLKE